MKQALTPEYLKQRLDLDEDTGRLIWRTAPDLPTEWNTRYAGKEALCGVNSHGYRHGQVAGKRVMAHRVVWAVANGAWPLGEIDHINGDPLDNRPINLRDVSHCENQRNMRRHRSNSSGVTGVNWHRRDRRWRAFITVDGVSVHLGNFKEKADAVAARAAASRAHGFHAGHGKVLSS